MWMENFLLLTSLSHSLTGLTGSNNQDSSDYGYHGCCLPGALSIHTLKPVDVRIYHWESRL